MTTEIISSPWSTDFAFERFLRRLNANVARSLTHRPAEQSVDHALLSAMLGICSVRHPFTDGGEHPDPKDPEPQLDHGPHRRPPGLPGGATLSPVADERADECADSPHSATLIRTS